MNDQTKIKNDSKDLNLDKSLKSQKSWKEVFRELSLNPTEDFFPEGRKDSPPQERDWELFNK
ncbi:MAG TPA: hypothetical protein LFW21_03255 [Rickettsia endosymbiont of Pyrocoelia pectoralis]|nr:hypothetical protein [Rickettsia endosymbiont of Pyrocoelia pectoralis]